MTPKLIDSGGQPYSPELEWARVGVQPKEPLTEMVTIPRKDLDALREEVSLWRKAALRMAKSETDGA